MKKILITMIHIVLSTACALLLLLAPDIYGRNNTSLRYEKAFTLLMYGIIEISTKNEVNTLRYPNLLHKLEQSEF